MSSIKILGFDIGVASIGWAFVEGDEIRDCGVRIFTKAENPKTGESLALPRREARGVRRRLARRRVRLNTIKKIICKEFDLRLSDYIADDGELPKAYQTNKDTKSPYELRYKALNERLSKEELARVILHIAKHRGYGNKHAKDGDDKDSGKVKKAIGENKTLLEQKGYESVGEYCFREFFKSIKDKDGETHNIPSQNIRNKKGNYDRCVSQKQLEDELKLIFAKQRKLGFNKEFEDAILEVAFYQRPLKDFDDKIGDCIFFDNEKRAPKESISAIEFVALTRIINTLKYLSKTTGEVYEKEIINKIWQKILENGKMTYAELRKILALDSSVFFKDKDLDYTLGIKEAEKIKFIEFKKLIKFKKALGSFDGLSREILDNIAMQIAITKDRQRLLEKLEVFPLNKEQKENLSQLNFSKYIDLSLKALNQILPFMREGRRYDEAKDDAKLQEKAKNTKKEEFLPPLKEFDLNLTNPVVARALAEFRKVLNALLKKYGKVHKIHLEFARDMRLDFDERERLISIQNDNFNKRQLAEDFCKEHGLEPSNANILKIKLWQEQQWHCMYSGELIGIPDLKDPTKLQVDHIYPYSRSFDDSYTNKVLVRAEWNQEKGNHTPFEAFGDDKNKWDKIVALAEKLPPSKKLNRSEKSKKDKLLDEKFNDKELGFLARNIVDTGYIARLVAKYIDMYLEFLPLEENENTSLARGEKGSKKHIGIVNGRLTSEVRHNWGLDPKDRDNHLHHAIDAIVIAYMNDKRIKAFADFRRLKELKIKRYGREITEDEYQEKKKELSCAPFDDFRNRTLENIDKIFVSRPPRKRARGTLHEETFYSIDDKKLLKAYGGKEGMQRALSLGKIRQIGTKIVKNGTMVRVDIFKDKRGRFYGVPIYTMDFALGVLPNKAAVSGKDKNGLIKEWAEMDSGYEFCFSLFKDDLILVQRKEMQEPELCYFVSFDSSNAQIDVRSHNNHFSVLNENQKLLFKSATQAEVIGESIGIQNLKVFEKWHVSPLGEVRKAEFSPRGEAKLKTSKKRKK